MTFCAHVWFNYTCLGVLITVGGVLEKLNVSAMNLLGRRLSIVGSCIGGIRETQEMLDFCAEHKIQADIELIPATPEAVNVAWDRAIAGDVKYRFVIDTKKTLVAPSAEEVAQLQSYLATQAAAAEAEEKKAT